jgi:N-acetylmuramoyl-L-alanine amidase
MILVNIIPFPSQNYNNRAFAKPDMIIIHYTGMETAQLALERMCDSTAPRVSAHYFIDKKGQIYQLVDEGSRAWHAGISCWEGVRDINSRSIGIELENKGHEFGYHAFPKAQIKSLITLLDSIRKRHDIEDKNIIGHSDIAPMRKKDPGELFPWHILARSGHGLSPATLWEMLYHPKRSIFFENLFEFGYECDNCAYFTPLNRIVYQNFLSKVRYNIKSI